MSSECDEVANGLRPQWEVVRRRLPLRILRSGTMDDCRHFVRLHMPGESEQVIDNAAWSLYHQEDD